MQRSLSTLKGVVQAFFEVTEPCVQVDLDGGSMIGIPEKFVLAFKHYRRKTLYVNTPKMILFRYICHISRQLILVPFVAFYLSNVCMCACLGVSYLVGHSVVDHVLAYIFGLSTVGRCLLLNCWFHDKYERTLQGNLVEHTWIL